jgi:hypothetical protein
MQRSHVYFQGPFYPSTERVIQYSAFLMATSIITGTISVRNLGISLPIELKICEKSII